MSVMTAEYDPKLFFEVSWVELGTYGSVKNFGKLLMKADSSYDACKKLEEIWPERSVARVAQFKR
jgi:hypothetical protein